MQAQSALYTKTEHWILNTGYWTPKKNYCWVWHSEWWIFNMQTEERTNERKRMNKLAGERVSERESKCRTKKLFKVLPTCVHVCACAAHAHARMAGERESPWFMDSRSTRSWWSSSAQSFARGFWVNSLPVELVRPGLCSPILVKPRPSLARPFDVSESNILLLSCYLQKLEIYLLPLCIF